MCTHQVHRRKHMKLKHFLGFSQVFFRWSFCCRFFALCLVSAHTYRSFGGSNVAGGHISATGCGSHALNKVLGPCEVSPKTTFVAHLLLSENCGNLSKNHHKILKYHESERLRALRAYFFVSGKIYAWLRHQKIQQHCDPLNPPNPR